MFVEGDRVKINSTTNSGRYKETVGKFGEVIKLHSNRVGVRVDGIDNPSSSIYVFWYREHELELSESKEESMLEKGYLVARVVFEDSCNPTKEYSYALYDAIGYGASGMLAVTDLNKVCRILAVHDVKDCEDWGLTLPTKALKGVCDDSVYKTMLEVSKQKKEIKAAMDARVKQLEKDAVYEMFATKDPELAELLSKYKSL